MKNSVIFHSYVNLPEGMDFKDHRRDFDGSCERMALQGGSLQMALGMRARYILHVNGNAYPVNLIGVCVYLNPNRS